LQKKDRFTRTDKLVKSAQFQDLRNTGRVFISPYFIFSAKENGKSISRLGLIVSKKTGKSVDRNRVKRRFREIFRKNRSSFPKNIDLVLIAKSGITGASFMELELSFHQLVVEFFRTN